MIKIDTREAEKALKDKLDQLSHRNVVIANTRAINTALMKARTAFRKEARKEYNLTSETVKDIDIKKATYSTVTGEVIAVSNPLSLSRFNPKFETARGTHSIKEVTVFDVGNRKKKKTLAASVSGSGKRKPKRGVSIEVKKGERKRIPFAFMITQGGGAGVGLQVWARGGYKGEGFQTSKKRLPITPLKTASPFSMTQNKDVLKPVLEKATVDFEQEMRRQIDLMLSK